MSSEPIEYVRARTVLLDALEAIGHQREAAILVGAQAVYLHAGAGDLAVPPTTTDSDIALSVDELHDEPELARALLAAGFVPGTQPGSWRGRGGVVVDLMVAPHQPGRSKATERAARIVGHERNVARVTRGLEPALVDHVTVDVQSLDRADGRRYGLRVAGPAALLAAKAVKLKERQADVAAGRKSRVRGKDALDILRLLQAVPMAELADGFERHRGEPNAAAVSAETIAYLHAEGSSAEGTLAELAAAEVMGDTTIAASFAALVEELLTSQIATRRPER